jgi:LysR family transcriptional regulator for bpeEF and oprC
VVIVDLFATMQTFATLVELGSFTKTAAALQLSRPQVTHAIQELEGSLGTRLLHRTTRHTRLTADGEVFYERVRDILAGVADATSLFASEGKPRGKLRADIPVAFARPWFFAQLREFSREFPDIELILGVTDRTLDLVAEGIDCVVRIGELPSSSMIGRRVGSAGRITCASPTYLEEFGTPATLDDLRRHRVVDFFSGPTRKRFDWQFLVGDEHIALKPASGILVNDTAAYVDCGLAGFGLIQPLGITVREHVATGALVEVLPSFRPRARPVSVLYPSKAHLPLQVRAFADWVASRFPDSGGEWIEPIVR